MSDNEIDLFMKDVSKVYTGYGNKNLEMLEITVPDAESEGPLCGGIATQTSSDGMLPMFLFVNNRRIRFGSRDEQTTARGPPEDFIRARG
ncbi:hypothetical protein CDAR_371731 [Caerostris darwini]|uniref:Uncharacterized protein n=1 Tax=Caerostris darwini TaxID=1538125 RepID=A0AAV4TDA2_9ARAC|nr:hypothetical protein CDAR_371731 [Caerostris darwini]